MSTLSEHAEQYLAMRRSMGFKLERAGRLLREDRGGEKDDDECASHRRNPSTSVDSHSL